MLKSIISYLLNKISSFLLKIFLKLRSPLLCAIIFYINLKKLKKIKNNTLKKTVKIIILSKSGGIEDIKAAYENVDESFLEFFELPRILIKQVFFYFLNGHKYEDYYTRDSSEEIKKENY